MLKFRPSARHYQLLALLILSPFVITLLIVRDGAFHLPLLTHSLSLNLMMIGGWPMGLAAGLTLLQASKSHYEVLANRDDLTGLPNRRAFLRLIEYITGRKSPGEIGVVIYDVDGL